MRVHTTAFRHIMLPLAAATLIVAAPDSCAAGRTSHAPQQPRTVQRIGLRLDETPLAPALSSLARAASVDLTIRCAPSGVRVGHALPSIDFRQGLRRLLAGHSYVLIERAVQPERDGTMRRQFELQFLPFCQPSHRAVSGPRPHGLPRPSHAPGAVEEVESVSIERLADRVRSAPSSEERAAALDALGYLGQNEASGILVRGVLSEALTDPDERLRRQALTTIKDNADEIPFDALSRVAQEDMSTAVRVQALEVLTERGGERAVPALRAALADSEVDVQVRARELIEAWRIPIP